jgi:putative ABC transport system ATP-binding protein
LIQYNPGKLFLGENQSIPTLDPTTVLKLFTYINDQALWEGTVEENLQQVYRLATHRHKVYNRQLIVEYLHLLHRDADFLQRPVSAISGGEGQILAFLRALQLSPKVLLLDEPTASLDGSTANSLEALVAAWLDADPQRAYLWTSHDPNQLQRLTTRQITLNGRRHGDELYLD